MDAIVKSFARKSGVLIKETPVGTAMYFAAVFTEDVINAFAVAKAKPSEKLAKNALPAAKHVSKLSSVVAKSSQTRPSTVAGVLINTGEKYFFLLNNTAAKAAFITKKKECGMEGFFRTAFSGFKIKNTQVKCAPFSETLIRKLTQKEGLSSQEQAEILQEMKAWDPNMSLADITDLSNLLKAADLSNINDNISMMQNIFIAEVPQAQNDNERAEKIAKLTPENQFFMDYSGEIQKSLIENFPEVSNWNSSSPAPHEYMSDEDMVAVLSATEQLVQTNSVSAAIDMPNILEESALFLAKKFAKPIACFLPEDCIVVKEELKQPAANLTLSDCEHVITICRTRLKLLRGAGQMYNEYYAAQTPEKELDLASVNTLKAQSSTIIELMIETLKIINRGNVTRDRLLQAMQDLENNISNQAFANQLVTAMGALGGFHDGETKALMAEAEELYQAHRLALAEAKKIDPERKEALELLSEPLQQQVLVFGDAFNNKTVGLDAQHQQFREMYTISRLQEPKMVACHLDEIPEDASWDFKHWMVEGEMPPTFGYGFFVRDYFKALSPADRNRFITLAKNMRSSAMITRLLESFPLPNPPEPSDKVQKFKKIQAEGEKEDNVKNAKNLMNDLLSDAKFEETFNKIILQMTAIQDPNDIVKLGKLSAIADQIWEQVAIGQTLSGEEKENWKAFSAKFGTKLFNHCKEQQEQNKPAHSWEDLEKLTKKVDAVDASAIDALQILANKVSDKDSAETQRLIAELKQDTPWVEAKKALVVDHLKRIIQAAEAADAAYNLQKQNLGYVSRAWGDATAALGTDPRDGRILTHSYSSTIPDFDKGGKAFVASRKVTNEDENFSSWCDMDINEFMWSKAANYDRYRGTKVELFTPNVTGADIANPKADIHNLRVTHQEIQVGNAWGALRGETDPSTGGQKYNDINIKSALNYDRDKVGFKTVVDMASRTAGKVGISSGVVTGDSGKVEVVEQEDVGNWKRVRQKMTQQKHADGSTVNMYGAHRGGQQETEMERVINSDMHVAKKQKNKARLQTERDKALDLLKIAEQIDAAACRPVNAALLKLKLDFQPPENPQKPKSPEASVRNRKKSVKQMDKDDTDYIRAIQETVKQRAKLEAIIWPSVATRVTELLQLADGNLPDNFERYSNMWTRANQEAQRGNLSTALESANALQTALEKEFLNNWINQDRLPNDQVVQTVEDDLNLQQKNADLLFDSLRTISQPDAWLRKASDTVRFISQWLQRCNDKGFVVDDSYANRLESTENLLAPIGEWKALLKDQSVLSLDVEATSQPPKDDTEARKKDKVTMEVTPEIVNININENTDEKKLQKGLTQIQALQQEIRAKITDLRSATTENLLENILKSGEDWLINLNTASVLIVDTLEAQKEIKEPALRDERLAALAEQTPVINEMYHQMGSITTLTSWLEQANRAQRESSLWLQAHQIRNAAELVDASDHLEWMNDTAIAIEELSSVIDKHALIARLESELQTLDSANTNATKLFVTRLNATQTKLQLTLRRLGAVNRFKILNGVLPILEGWVRDTDRISSAVKPV